MLTNVIGWLMLGLVYFLIVCTVAGQVWALVMLTWNAIHA